MMSMDLSHARRLVGTAALLLAGAGCGEQTGSPTQPDLAPPAPAIASASALAFTQVSSGGSPTADGDHSCAVTGDNRAYCWGNNDFGQLGNNSKTGPQLCDSPYGPLPCSTRPIPVAGGLSFRQVTAGGYHSCGVTTDHRAYCWGANYTGALGDGTTTPRLTPVPVAGGLLFRQVEAGFISTCGITYPDNRAYCWGSNATAQLGDGTTTDRWKPRAVAGGHTFRQVSAGGWHACALTTANVAYCWGKNKTGQVGDSTTVGTRYHPVRVAAGTRQFRQIDAGLEHTCAVTTDYRAFCWGEGRQGQTGNGKGSRSHWPRAVAGGLSFERVTAGFHHTCGETTVKRGYCWGQGFEGALGDGTMDYHLSPVAVAGGLSFAQMSAGNDYTCGRTPTNVTYCWGWNRDGFLGDGTTTDRLVPTAVVGPS